MHQTGSLLADFPYLFRHSSVHFTNQSSLPGDILVSWESSTQKANLGVGIRSQEKVPVVSTIHK